MGLDTQRLDSRLIRNKRLQISGSLCIVQGHGTNPTPTVPMSWHVQIYKGKNKRHIGDNTIKQSSTQATESRPPKYPGTQDCIYYVVGHFVVNYSHSHMSQAWPCNLQPQPCKDLSGPSLQGLHGLGGAAHHYLLVLLFELYILDAKAKLLCGIKRVS